MNPFPRPIGTQLCSIRSAGEAGAGGTRGHTNKRQMEGSEDAPDGRPLHSPPHSERSTPVKAPRLDDASMPSFKNAVNLLNVNATTLLIQQTGNSASATAEPNFVPLGTLGDSLKTAPLTPTDTLESLVNANGLAERYLSILKTDDYHLVKLSQLLEIRSKGELEFDKTLDDFGFKSKGSKVRPAWITVNVI